ncbi:MAG: hypothetical protein LBC94_08845 [Desulfovibrio sp.]|jgi:hypothetical protein|nr:hypothetical protein [Desulfovibrio sp.]
MSAQRIATTPKSRIQSLSCQGIRVVEHYYQIKELVRARLGDGHALLFAEPGGLQHGDVIDWYSPLQGPVSAVADLPEDEARMVAAQAEQMARDIRNLADELKADAGSQTNILRGMTLESALHYPDASCIYAVGGIPVMTCWGFSSSTQGARPEDLARFGERFAPSAPPPPAQAQAQAPPKTDSRAFAWLCLLPLLLLLLLILFASFGSWRPLIAGLGPIIQLPPLPWVSAGDSRAEQQALEFEENALRMDINGLREKLSTLAALCAPERRASQPEDAPGQPLVIPEKADDYAFLQGRWINDAGLVSRLDGRPITVTYTFDASGNGTATVRQADGQDCSGKARAHFAGQGILRIETENQTCPDENKSYKAEIIECRQTAEGKTSCLGKSADGADWGGNVHFRRIP